MTTFALVGSPVVASATWQLVADVLNASGHDAVIAESADPPDGVSYWRRHAESAARSLVDCTSRPVLVAHSGAGPLLPAIRQALGDSVSAYLFVDAALPSPGASRLDLLPPHLAKAQRSVLEAGGRLPAWSDADLAPLVPDVAVRATLLAGIRPQPLGFWTEPIEVFAEWPDAPCAYLRLSPAYELYVDQARSRGWPIRTIDGGHFHLLVEPVDVATAMVELVAELGIGGPHPDHR